MPLSSFVLPIIDNGMKAETPSFEAHQFVRVRRGDAVRRLIQRDKTPLAVLFMAAVVGTLAGLVGVAFEKSVNWVQNQRIGALAQVADHWYLHPVHTLQRRRPPAPPADHCRHKQHRHGVLSR